MNAGRHRRKRMTTAYLMHTTGLVREIADRIVVFGKGDIIETMNSPCFGSSLLQDLEKVVVVVGPDTQFRTVRKVDGGFLDHGRRKRPR